MNAFIRTSKQNVSNLKSYVNSDCGNSCSKAKRVLLKLNVIKGLALNTVFQQKNSDDLLHQPGIDPDIPLVIIMSAGSLAMWLAWVSCGMFKTHLCTASPNTIKDTCSDMNAFIRASKQNVSNLNTYVNSVCVNSCGKIKYVLLKLNVIKGLALSMCLFYLLINTQLKIWFPFANGDKYIKHRVYDMDPPEWNPMTGLFSRICR